MLFIIDLESRDCCSTPPDASEIEPRQRRDTKSRELPRIKLDIYSGQAYEKQREEKGTFKAEAGALHCKVLKKVAMSNTMLEKYAGRSSGVAFRTAWPSRLDSRPFSPAIRSRWSSIRS